MKINKIAFLALFLMVAIAMNAQTFGVRAGLNYSKFRGPEISDNLSTETHSLTGGFHFGLTYAYNVTDLFSIRAELVYIQNGTGYDFDGQSFYIIRQSDKVTFEKGDIDYNLKVSNAYISIPILPNYRINNKWEVFAGPYINLLIGPTGRGQLTFFSDSRPDEIQFNQSLDFSYNNDDASEISGQFLGSISDIGILVDGEEVTLPRFAGAYTLQGEKTGNKINFLDVGLTAGFHYFLNKGFFVGFQLDYGFLDITNDKVDINLQSLNEDNSFKFQDDDDKHLGLHFSFGFRF